MACADGDPTSIPCGSFPRECSQLSSYPPTSWSFHSVRDLPQQETQLECTLWYLTSWFAPQSRGHVCQVSTSCVDMLHTSCLFMITSIPMHAGMHEKLLIMAATSVPALVTSHLLELVQEQEGVKSVSVSVVTVVGCCCCKVLWLCTCWKTGVGVFSLFCKHVTFTDMYATSKAEE